MGETYDRIRELCKRDGISVTGLERELGFARGSLSKIDTHTPSAKKIQLIADRFNVDPAVITGRKSKRTAAELFDLFMDAIRIVPYSEERSDDPNVLIRTDTANLLDKIKVMNRDELKKMSEYADFLLSRRE